MRKHFLLILFLVVFSGQSYSKVPVTGRKQFRMLPEKMVLGMSLTNYNVFSVIYSPVAMNEQAEETRNIFLSVYGVGGTLGILAYSRKHEYDTDKAGMVFMALASYYPSEVAKFWERMSNNNSLVVPQFLSIHSSDKNHVKAVQEFSPTTCSITKNSKL